MTQVELLTKDDLENLRLRLLEDLMRMLEPKKKVVRDWIKSAEVRRILNISHGSLQNLRVNGMLNPRKIGGTYYYRTEEVEALFKS
ncbi:MAG: DNA-binding protein [Mongoliibacter sp.]|uniref:helix-turn-helix domain-containing protein n=1 Tax=Mongoliibacter sp. TaxID=2022438 RepID=UPI0012F0B5FE|nr:helix-turn-helix domain-containing protein [Mongoliibacter sp.]TVP52357.1 MAG: DNA-binding protein [Mongoliibacter sp.]